MFIFGPVMLLIVGVLAVYTLVDLRRHWATFWDDNITGDDKTRAYRAVFFLLIPVGVLLHELGHALAVWGMGGRGVEFNWSLLSGYVVPDRTFGPLGTWWLYFSGNLVSILLALVGLVVAVVARRPMVKFLGFTFFIMEWFFSLVGYPLLSLGSQDGDWVGIYGIPPLPMKGALAAAHIALLVLGYVALRSARVRRWEMMLSTDNRAIIEAREAESRAQPDDPRPRLALAAFYAQRGETALSKAALEDALAVAPDNPDAHTLAGAQAADAERYAEAVGQYAAAIAVLPPGPRRGRVEYMQGWAYVRMDRAADAVTALTRAIEDGFVTAEAYYWRGRAYQRLRETAAAQSDFARAAGIDPGGATGGEAAKELAAMRLEAR